MQTRPFPLNPDDRSPAGAEVRYLMGGGTGDMIHSTVPPGQVNRATVHTTVSEFWFVLSGEGQIWRRDATGEETTALESGISIDIPVGTTFQYRCNGADPLRFSASQCRRGPDTTRRRSSKGRGSQMRPQDDADPGLPLKLWPCSNGEYVPPPLDDLRREAMRRARVAADEHTRVATDGRGDNSCCRRLAWHRVSSHCRRAATSARRRRPPSLAESSPSQRLQRPTQPRLRRPFTDQRPCRRTAPTTSK